MLWPSLLDWHKARVWKADSSNPWGLGAAVHLLGSPASITPRLWNRNPGSVSVHPPLTAEASFLCPEGIQKSLGEKRGK